MSRLRAVSAAALPLLLGCGVAQALAPAGSPPPKATATAVPLPPEPTPFAPIGPTAVVDPAAPPPAPVDVWPPPYTYGSAPTPSVAIPPPAASFAFPDGSVNIALIGSDRRSGRSFRTDTLVIVSIQPRQGLVAMLSIPRDLYLYLPGYGMSRVNTAWVYGETFGYPGGGPQLLFDTLRYNLGLSIERYAMVEMQGFRTLVDILGGIDVRVACAYTDWRLRRPDLPENLVSSWALYTVQPGVVHMDGDYALWYARARSRSSDFDRSRRQHEVLRAAYRRALRPAVMTRLPELYDLARASLSTNLGLSDVLALAPFAASLEPAHVRSRFIGKPAVSSYRVPGSGAAVLLPDADAVRRVLDEAFAPAPQVLSPVADVIVDVVPGPRPDVAWLAIERLNYAGIEADLAPHDPALGGPTRLFVESGVSVQAAEAVRAALGLDPAALIWQTGNGGRALRLYVGDDFQPCFDPTGSAG